MHIGHGTQDIGLDQVNGCSDEGVLINGSGTALQIRDGQRLVDVHRD
jgi:hypothetical protein